MFECLSNISAEKIEHVDRTIYSLPDARWKEHILKTILRLAFREGGRMKINWRAMLNAAFVGKSRDPPVAPDRSDSQGF